MDNAIGEVVFKKCDCYVYLGRYADDRYALYLKDKHTGERVAVASVNLPSAPMQDGEVAIKNWSENEGILQTLVDADIVSRPIRRVPTGYVFAYICKINPEIIPESK